MATKNYTLGRGKVHVARITNGVTGGFRYIGNTPEFSLNIESETLDHYSSDEGIREKDDSVPLEVNRTGSLVTDNIDPKNVALFFFGSESVITESAGSVVTQVLTDLMVGHSYKLGVTPQLPAGVFGVATADFNVFITGTPGTVLASGTDYVMDYDSGLITFTDSSLLATAGASVSVEYKVAASTRSRVISGSEPVECSVIFISKNPKGADYTFLLPYVKLTPNGDYALKGDEWQQIPLAMEVLKATGKEAIYRDGKPVYA